MLENLRIDANLRSKLQEKCLITSEMAQRLQYSHIDAEKNTMLFDHVLEFSKKEMKLFIKILQESQPHVAKLFTEYECQGMRLNQSQNFHLA